jgi:hypothetical protein
VLDGSTTVPDSADTSSQHDTIEVRLPYKVAFSLVTT